MIIIVLLDDYFCIMKTLLSMIRDQYLHIFHTCFNYIIAF